MVYFYLNSLSHYLDKKGLVPFTRVIKTIEAMKSQINIEFGEKILISSSMCGKLYLRPFLEQNLDQEQKHTIITEYGTSSAQFINAKIQIKPRDIVLKNYSSMFSSQENQNHFGFMSTIIFLNDLIQISHRLNNVANRLTVLIDLLMELNK